MDPHGTPPPIPARDPERPSFTETPLRSTPNVSVVEGVAVDLATVLSRTLQDLLRNTAAEVRCPLQTFAGLEQEDPHLFITRLNEHFIKSRITENEERVGIAAKQLRGEAARWFAPYNSYFLTYTEFQNKLINRYDNASIRAVIKSKLYGDRQKDHEPVSIFIIRKRALFSRVDPDTPEEAMIPVISELLSNRLKAYLRGKIFQNFEEFSRIAEQIEEDLGGPTFAHGHAPSTPAPQAPRSAPPHVGQRQNFAPAPQAHRPTQAHAGQNQNFAQAPQAPRSTQSQVGQNQNFPRAPQAPRPTQAQAGPTQNFRAPQAPRSAAQQPVAPRRDAPDPDIPPTPCRYCQAWHYHAACPRNPHRPENS